MALSPQLLQFKSSGVYRLEFDKSITSNINVETLRLIVGHSRKGPYNTPVLISTVEEFSNVFGAIDRKLEKKGMFFHRSAVEALSRGPILALNSSSFDSTDKGSYQRPITNGKISALASSVDVKDYTDFFDMDKFMTPSDSRVLNSLETAGEASNQALNLVNIKQTPITVFVRKAQAVTEFEISAREWYGEGNVPEFMNDFDYVSDFMVDIFVFKGNFDATAASTDPVYGAYFDANGLKKDKLAEFANLRQVTLEAQYTGSLIPGFKDLEGRNLYIETIINNESRRTGLFCAINEDAISNDAGTKLDLVGHEYATAVDYELLSYVIEAGVNDRVISEDFTGSNAPVTLVGGSPTTAATINILTVDTLGEVLTYQIVNAGAGYTSLDVLTIPGGDANATLTLDATTLAQTATLAAGTGYAVALIDGTYATLGTAFTVDYASVGNTPATFPIKAGDFVPALAANRLARVKRVAKSGSVYTIYCDVEVAAAWADTYVKSFESATLVYKPLVLSGATLSDKSIQDCLTGLTGGNGLHAALVDKDLIDFRYVVDTFSSFDENGIQNKEQLASLAKARQNASAILNAPTVADFKSSTNPSFTDADGIFKVAFIATGGNLDKNPTSLYSLPGINGGANYAFYYGPGLLVSDNGKDLIVPPAAYISNNFIDKYTSASPWSIVAGPRRGVVGGTGVKGTEYSFDKSDRDVLEPFGINPVVFQRGVGLTILGNKTAQQSVKSALSSAHVREALIYIQEGIAAILKDYVFEFNNTQTRLEIKTLADSFMESVKADGGVYAFKNTMDQTNNTDDVIDNNIGVIDTYVEPVKGLEIVVHRTTILNTGEIETGNFN
jgi:hypothetical protein